MNMSKTFFHYSYKVQEFGKTIEGTVCYPGDADNEEAITTFMREDVADTFPDGAVLSLDLIAITDAYGKRR